MRPPFYQGGNALRERYLKLLGPIAHPHQTSLVLRLLTGTTLNISFHILDFKAYKVRGL